MDIEKAIEELHSLLESELNDAKCAELRNQLREVRTASELVAFTKENFLTMFDHLRYMLTDYVKEYLPQDVCGLHGILINPERVNDPFGAIEEYMVISDGSVRTVQDTAESVFYFGNVDLTISAGSAFVLDTCHPVTAEGKVNLSVDGDTVVNSTGPITLTLNERARATVEDAAVVRLAGRSFLESKSGKPWIKANDQAQLVVSGGSAAITMDGNSRGVILNKANPNEDYRVQLNGQSVLFVESTETKNCEVDQKNRSFFIDGSAINLQKNMLLDAIVPWRERKAVYLMEQELGNTPNRIRMDMRPFLPNLDEPQKEAWMRADNEHDLCQQMKDWIPEMVEKGLTGEVLRATFSAKALCNANIFTGRNEGYSFVSHDGPQYHFGDELVNAVGCKDPVYCFENALLLTDSKGFVAQSANAIGSGNNVVVARGDAHAIIYGQGQAQASQQATVWVGDRARVDARDFATVYASNFAEVAGHDHAWIELYGYNKATVEHDCRVFTVDDCTVETFDNAKVWHAAYASDCRPTVIARNGVTEAASLDSWEGFNALRVEWEKEKEKPLQKSAGPRR